jgi:hypothetical protein
MSTRSTYFSRALVLACGVAMCSLIASATASAQPLDRKTIVTFSAPVEIPGGQVLKAGTYVFRLLDSQSNRHIVQILDSKESHIYATVLAIANYRLKSTGDTVMTFAERVAGDPQAIRAWFYPGDRAGQEFAYPRKRAVVLAAATHQPVLYIPDEMEPNIAAPVKTATEAPVVALKEAPVKAVTPTGQDVAMSTVVQTTPTATPAASAPASPTRTPRELPHTAGYIPVVALSGLLSLGLGLGLKLVRRTRRA